MEAKTKVGSDSKPAATNQQHARFLETARALGCDEDEAAFDEKLKAVVGPKPAAPKTNDSSSSE